MPPIILAPVKGKDRVVPETVMCPPGVNVWLSLTNAETKFGVYVVPPTIVGGRGAKVEWRRLVVPSTTVCEFENGGGTVAIPSTTVCEFEKSGGTVAKLMAVFEVEGLNGREEGNTTADVYDAASCAELTGKGMFCNVLEDLTISDMAVGMDENGVVNIEAKAAGEVTGVVFDICVVEVLVRYEAFVKKN